MDPKESDEQVESGFQAKKWTGGFLLLSENKGVLGTQRTRGSKSQKIKIPKCQSVLTEMSGGSQLAWVMG